MKSSYLLNALLIIASIIPVRSFTQEEIKLTVVNKSHFPAAIPALERSGGIKIIYANSIKTKEIVQADSLNKKLLRSFSRSFENAINSVWYTCDKKHKLLLVTFEKDERTYTALYSKDGYLIYATSEASENDLTAKDKKLIRKIYDGYLIVNLIEIITNLEISWSICLQKGKEIIFVKLVKRSLEELARTTTETTNVLSKN